MPTSTAQKSQPVLSKRSLGYAGVAAFLGCFACCAVPLLAVAGVAAGCGPFCKSDESCCERGTAAARST
jgi:hypothetical protein